MSPSKHPRHQMPGESQKKDATGMKSGEDKEKKKLEEAKERLERDKRELEELERD